MHNGRPAVGILFDLEVAAVLEVLQAHRGLPVWLGRQTLHRLPGSRDGGMLQALNARAGTPDLGALVALGAVPG